MGRITGYTSSAKYKCLEDLQKDSVELCLIYCGWEECKPGHRFGPNFRKSYVLHVVKRGKGVLEINGKHYELKKGDAFLIPPDIEAWYEADKEEPWFYCWVGFTGLKSQEIMENAGFSSKQPVRHIECVDELSVYVDKILDEYHLTYECELKRKAYLMLFFSVLIEEYKKKAPYAVYSYPGSVYARYAIDYINAHYNEKIKISELADYIGVTRSYLATSFKKAMGCSPQEYLINLRMDKASSLLKKTNMSVSSVANAVGYNDQLAFSKAFKQHFGISPRGYREEKDKLVYYSKKREEEI